MKPNPWWNDNKIIKAHIEWETTLGRSACDEWGVLYYRGSMDGNQSAGKINSYNHSAALSVPLISRVDLRVGDYIFFPKESSGQDDLDGFITKVLNIGSMIFAAPYIDHLGGFKFNNYVYKTRVINYRFPVMAGWEKEINVKIADDVVIGGGFKEVKPARDPNATYCPNGHTITKFYRGGEFCPTCNLVQTADERGKRTGWIEPF